MPNPSIPSQRTSYSTLMTTALVGAGLLSFSLGCRPDNVAHYRVPKEAPASHPDHPGHAEEGMTPSQAPSTAPTVPEGKQSLMWTLPKGWTQQPGEGMRFATLKAPIAGRLEATVVVLPGPAGGELANVNRWRGQIGLPPLDEASLVKARQVLKTKAGSVNVYDFVSDGQAKSRMVAGYILTPDGNTWFLKMSGDADPAAKAKPDFMRILESIRLD